MPIRQSSPLTALRDPLFLAILAWGAFLIFYQLGQRPLWQDEAETASLARSVLKTGLPHVTDGVNIVSQEERREFGQDMVWRWSPWLQIYMSAAGQFLGERFASAGPPTDTFWITFWARFLFAVTGLGCIAATYLLILSRFGDVAWARLSALLLTLSVPFLLYARQGRYYSAGGLILLLVFWGFLGDWQRRRGPLWAIVVGMVLLFHANYLLVISLVPSLLVAATLLYRQRLDLRRIALAVGLTTLFILPSLYLYGIGRQTGLFKVIRIPTYIIAYFGEWFMFMMPLPVAAALLWRWRNFFLGRGGPADPRERFCLFLCLFMLGSLLILGVFPQRFHRYIVHFYPLCAILLAWAGLAMWRFFKPAGALFLILVGLTNWLHLIPMERLKIIERPFQNDFRMLSSVNIPLKLYLTELFCGYPDVNTSLIDFFLTHAKPGQTILAEYGDLPLQFYTPFRVIGGLQGPIPATERPDWVSMRRELRINREGLLFDARQFIRDNLDLEHDYERIELDRPDATFGNRPGPQFHSFIPLEGPQLPLVVYKRKDASGEN